MITNDETQSALKLLRGNGKPLGFVVLAVQIAAGADDMKTLLSWGIGRTKPPRPLPPLPHVDEWLSLYRNHRAFNDEIFAAFNLFPDLTASEIQEGLRLHTKATQEEIETDVKEMTKEEQEQFMMFFRGIPFPPDQQSLKAMLDNLDTEAKPDTEDDADPFDDLLKSATGQFYIRVWLPCWILHRIYPQLLLRQARLSDQDALDKILRLDKSIVHDPGIAAVWHDIMHNGTRSNKNRFTNAMADGPKGKLSHKTMRIGLAGLISQFALLFQCRVTAPEIAKLFDAISQVRAGRIDTHLPKSPQAVYQGIYRNSDWPSITPHIG